MAQAARLNLRLQKELKLLLSDPPPGVSLPLLTDDCTSSSLLTSIEARIEGPAETVYSKGVFTIKIQVPERYPFQPPNITFVTPIYHPNIDNRGRICLDILNLPPKGAWQPSLNISTVLTSIGLLLSEPNPDDGLMAEASKEYKYNRQAFDQKARTWTEKYAHPGANRNGDGDALAKTSIEIDIGKADVCPEDPAIDNEGARKKLRVMDEKPSLKTLTQLGRKSSDNKETMTRTRRLSLSSAQKCIVGSASSVLPQHVITSERSPFLKDVSNGNKEQLELAPEIMETIIISDSEESDDECERFSSSKLPLMQKRTLEKSKNNEWN